MRDAPSTRRHADHRSSSFLRRMKRLKLIPQVTSLDCMKFKVEKGIAIVAVQPCAEIRASEVHIPSHPESQSPVPESVLCSSVISASRCVPNGLIWNTYALRRLCAESMMISK